MQRLTFASRSVSASLPALSAPLPLPVQARMRRQPVPAAQTLAPDLSQFSTRFVARKKYDLEQDIAETATNCVPTNTQDFFAAAKKGRWLRHQQSLLPGLALGPSPVADRQCQSVLGSSVEDGSAPMKWFEAWKPKSPRHVFARTGGGLPAGRSIWRPGRRPGVPMPSVFKPVAHQRPPRLHAHTKRPL